jgi:collagenase-like PrtC family protease
MSVTRAELTMGPVLFHWPAEARRDFWFRVADEAPVDTACLGEVVCAKRAPFFDRLAVDVAERLMRAGKKVVWSSLAQVVNTIDRKASLASGEIRDEEVEANDASVLPLLKGRPHRIGACLNVYNEAALAHLAGEGAHHFCLSPELPFETVEALAAEAGRRGASVEVQIFGRASLALSARCYHARAHGRTRDNCLFVCENDPDGMDLTTRAGKPFLAVNGIQTLSHRYLELSSDIPRLRGLGVRHFRLSPHAIDMVGVARAYRDLLDEVATPDETAERLRRLDLPQPTMNGFLHRRPGYLRVQAAE